MREKGRKINKFPVPLVRHDEHHPRCDEGTLHRDEPKELKDARYGFVAMKRRYMSNILMGSSRRMRLDPDEVSSPIEEIAQF